MKSKLESESLRILTILKLDAQTLYGRIKEREREYIAVFAQKRTRDHFPSIFKNRYENTELCDLKKCSEDVIVALDSFHRIADNMRWYMQVTEDMPATVADKLERKMYDLDEAFEALMLLVDAELGVIPRQPAVSQNEDNDAGMV